MGARYLKDEEGVITRYYPTASRTKILKLIPNRTLAQIGVHARTMGIHRTTSAKGNSIREGRKGLRSSWSDKDNNLLDQLYPELTHAQLRAAFPNRTYKSIRSHAQKRHLHRTTEAAGRQINIGRENAKENDR